MGGHFSHYTLKKAEVSHAFQRTCKYLDVIGTIHTSGSQPEQ